MNVDLETYELHLEVVEHRVADEIRHSGDEQVKQTCLLHQRVLQACGHHWATQPLLLFFIACYKVMTPEPRGVLDQPGLTVEPLPFTALRDLLPGCQMDLLDMLDVGIPLLEHLMEESQLRITRDVLRDVCFRLVSVKNCLRS